MKSSKTFNNFSDKLLKEIPKLKPGQSVVFQMLNGVPNPEPDEKERSKDPILYPKVQLMTRYRIFDKYQKDDEGNEVGGFVDGGLVESWKGEEPIAFRCFVTGSNPSLAKAAMPSRFQGKFEVRGGNIREEELYEILYLSPQRQGTPCPDASVEQIFKIVDSKADTKATFSKVERLKKAIKYAEDATPQKQREIMAALNQPVYQDPEVLKAKTVQLATDKYDDFIATYENADTSLIFLLREALNNGILSHNIATGEVKVGSVKITDLKVEDPNVVATELLRWMNTSENGKDVLANIKQQVEGKKEVKQ